MSEQDDIRYDVTHEVLFQSEAEIRSVATRQARILLASWRSRFPGGEPDTEFDTPDQGHTRLSSPSESTAQAESTAGGKKTTYAFNGATGSLLVSSGENLTPVEASRDAICRVRTPTI